MSQKVRTGLVPLFVIALTIQANFCTVSGDLRVLDQGTNKLVFQTASDFVRTGCGSFLNRSFIVVSDPLDACDVPASPPIPSLLSQTFFPNHDLQNKQWVLLALGDGGCDLKTKFRNAASAGYSAIIVGTDEPHEDIVKPGLHYEDDEEFIDVHLVNSLDIQVLSKQFAYPKKFTMGPPTLSRCKEEYQKTWWRSRNVSLIRRVWKKSMEICWECSKWILVIMGKLTIGIKSIMPSVFHNRDTFSSIAISLASIVFFITVMMIISIQDTAKKLTKYKSNHQEPTPDFSKNPNTDFKDDKSGRFDGNSSSSEASSAPPPRQHNSSSYSSSSQSKQKIQIDKTLYHRINLDIRLTETLTRVRVNNAYRDMARRYHPDKNGHLDANELLKITEEFRRKKKSRDILLEYCTS